MPWQQARNPATDTLSVPDLEVLQQRLGYTFRDVALLELALTHPSVAHERSTPLHDNQRLEFLGDAVLQLVLSAELYLRFGSFSEGALTKARAKLVNRRALAEHGRRLGLGEFLLLSRGEESQGGRVPTLRLGVADGSLRAQIRSWLERIQRLGLRLFNCNAIGRQAAVKA